MANEKRLIDADALLEEIQRLRKAYKKVTTFTANNVIACIKIAPTADAVEVVHGRNKTTLHPVDEFICSVCGYVCQDTHKYIFDEDGEYWSCYEFEFNYCPDCGAKMDGDGQ